MKNFQCYQLAISAVRLVRPLIEQVERSDRDLGRQMRRAASSVPLNVAEGSRSAGRNASVRYSTAMGSAQEMIAALETAEALGYLDGAQLPKALDRFDHVVAILWKLK
jgi:four helix bundle protein